ncbi:hypothetical protein GIB67_033694 [Kingdonia uniflora]|uniref:RNase H type-1 domain-containing protein n=1 Tax=Kingdonia uniflora TaxID=39325 RepID=A0A7J7P4G1_9MAGN|nr:hypothetical protein GIB67_033694 [Kingdonia uniflora]
MWDWLCDCFQITYFDYSIQVIMDQEKKRSTYVRDLWYSVSVALLAHLWKTRNRMLPDNVRFNVIRFKQSVTLAIQGSSEISNGIMHNTVDDLCVIKCFGVKCKMQDSPIIRSLSWIPPRKNEVRMCCDEASKSNPSVGGPGTVFRDCYSNVLHSISSGSGVVSTNYAEGRTVLDGKHFSSEHGMQVLWITSDSKLTIQAFSNDHVQWRFKVDWIRLRRCFIHTCL